MEMSRVMFKGLIYTGEWMLVPFSEIGNIKNELHFFWRRQGVLECGKRTRSTMLNLNKFEVLT
jgi:hypothetical protein